MTVAIAAIPGERLDAWRQAEARVDASGMRARIAGLADQLAEGTRRGRDFAASLPRSDSSPSVIVVAGMGGSAIGAELAAAYTTDRRQLPVLIHRGYGLPTGLDDRAMVLASSYSGNTEETLSSYVEAKARGLRTIAVTTGGRLGENAREAGDPTLVLPKGLPPRAALGHAFSACALTMARLDPLLDHDAEAEELGRAADFLRPWLDRWLQWSADNPALQVAASMAKGLPIVHAGHSISIAAAHRWKAQLNENGKIPAWTGELPEHNHNEIVGLAGSHPLTARLCLIYLETPWDDSRIQRRFEFLTAYSTGKVEVQHRVRSQGESPLAGMLWLCGLGDCASFFVSIITGQDPTPVTPIVELKAALRNR